MFKRVGLFLILNILVVVSISFIVNILGLGNYLTNAGINYGGLMVFCLIWGMGGSLISLMLSRFMAKKMMNVHVIDSSQARKDYEVKLMSMVYKIAKKAGMTTMPEVGIFPSNEINAFATGPSKNRSLVAVSTGLLNNLNDDEVEAVIAHEIAHIVNGDMVTMTLLQGVVNAFVMFLARILANIVSAGLSRNNENNRSPGFVYFILVFVFEMILMVLGSIVVASFSRHREYRADAGGADLTSKKKMANALMALKRNLSQNSEESTPPSLAAFQIFNKNKIAYLFSTHPPLDDRIKKLLE